MKLVLLLALTMQATIIISQAIIDGGEYQIIPKGTMLALGSQDFSNTFGGNVVAHTNQCSDYQKFILHQQTPSDVYQIEIKGDGYYITNFFSPPAQFPLDPQFFQNYRLIPAGDYYMISPVANPGNVLTLAPDQTSLSWQLQTGADNQLFSFVEASSCTCIPPQVYDLTASQCVDCTPPQVYLASTGACGTCSAPKVYNAITFACENCPGTQLYNFDGTCISQSSCPPNLRGKQAGVPICQYPCHNTQSYQVATGKCKQSCPSPYTIKDVNGYQVCA